MEANKVRLMWTRVVCIDQTCFRCPVVLHRCVCVCVCVCVCGVCVLLRSERVDRD